jgi:hypothetical protein
MTTQSKHRLVTASTIFAGAAFAAELPYALLGRTAWNSFVAPWAVLSTGMFLIAFLAVRFDPGGRTTPMWIAGSLGITIAVLGHALFDAFANGHDHTLFPIEIVMMTVLAVPGAFAGVAAARVSEPSTSSAPPRSPRARTQRRRPAAHERMLCAKPHTGART